MNLSKNKILNLNINNIDYSQLIHFINKSIHTRKQITITGVNVSTLNLLWENKNLKKIFSSFSILHPDGIGVFFAAKILQKGFIRRITGSDFYKLLIEQILSENWNIFFFGDEDFTLDKIKKKHPSLNIVGLQNGFNFSTKEVIKKINSSQVDILVVGMGAPKQEKWIQENKENIDVPVLLSVGEGIRIFAGNKVRGFKIIQKLGFEWFIRLINNPRMYWKRYILGIPQFIYRFFKYEVIRNHDI